MNLRTSSIATLAIAIAAILAAPRAASAHCDTVDGPVVAAARTAIRTGVVTPVLQWVPKASEPAVREAFARTIKARAASADARELADTWFFETLVRLHRAGEGEPYTGLKPAGAAVDPAVAAADKALEQGTGDELVKHLTTEIGAGIRERFERAAQARKSAAASVEDGRKYVAAYVDLMHYLELLDQAGAGHEKHAH